MYMGRHSRKLSRRIIPAYLESTEPKEQGLWRLPSDLASLFGYLPLHHVAVPHTVRPRQGESKQEFWWTWLASKKIMLSWVALYWSVSVGFWNRRRRVGEKVCVCLHATGKPSSFFSFSLFNVLVTRCEKNKSWSELFFASTWKQKTGTQSNCVQSFNRVKSNRNVPG